MYEDNHIIAVEKPAGVLSQGDKTGDRSLVDDVKDYLKQKYKKPGNVFLAPVHRLDRPVSGIVLYAKTSKGAGRLSEQFREREIQKTYHAVVVGKMQKPAGEIVNFIKKVSYSSQAFIDGQSFGQVAGTPKEMAKPKKAELTYKVVRTNGTYSLLELKPKTGRFHQIRIQLASLGHPIVGDGKYAAPSIVRQFRKDWTDRKSIALCATSLSFTTATLRQGLRLSSAERPQGKPLQQAQGKPVDNTVNISIPIPEDWKKLF